MRIIPKKTKVRNTVWKCYTMADVLVALMIFSVIFLCITNGKWLIAVAMALVSIILFMPTQDGIFYSYLLENVKFITAQKDYIAGAEKPKENLDTLLGLKEIKENGLIVYANGYFGRAVKIGQKNFGMQTESEQNADISYFANAFKLLDGTQEADLIKIDRPITLDTYAEELFHKVRNNTDEIKGNVLSARLCAIDKLNNLNKRYLSEYYLVVYGRNGVDLENTAINMANEIGKSGLYVKVLNGRETAVFLKYGYSRNFDEREVKGVDNDKLTEWVKPKKLTFRANGYNIDGVKAAVFAIAEYPLRVKNAWGVELFHIPNTKVVLHVRPVEKSKAIRRIDKCINEMETKQLLSERASEANGAQIHRETMENLLDSLQAENEALLDTTLTVTAYNYANEENYKRTVRRAIMTHGFKASTLYGLQIEAFKRSHTGVVRALQGYQCGINSSSLAAVFPFVRPFVIDEKGVLLGKNANNRYPFIFNIWKRGSLYQNSNAMVIGKSGSGKSFFLKTFMVNEWSNHTRVICLDPEAEYLSLTRNLQGNVIDVGNAQEGRINPFHIYKILTEEGTVAEPSITFHTHLKTLESFFKIVLVGAHSDVIELINNLVIDTYKQKGITEQTDCSKLSADDFPLFTDLLDTLKNKDKENMDELTLRDMHTAELYLEKFVSGRYSDTWNGPSTLETDAALIDFNFQSLFANKNNVVANAQMLLVFRFIEQEIINARELNRNGNNLRTMIICDEAHLFIDAKFPIALDFFYSMSKRIRKYNGAFIPATQNIADWNASEELRGKTSAILKNSQYTFIFKLSEPDMKDVLDIYSSGQGFNKSECEMITKAETGQTFFIGSSALRASVKISASKEVKELFEEKEVKRKIEKEMDMGAM